MKTCKNCHWSSTEDEQTDCNNDEYAVCDFLEAHDSDGSDVNPKWGATCPKWQQKPIDCDDEPDLTLTADEIAELQLAHEEADRAWMIRAGYLDEATNEITDAFFRASDEAYDRSR